MKYALVIPDGCADEIQASLGNQTPLQAAHVPEMDRVAQLGAVGLTDNVPECLPSGSDVGTMSLFGYDPQVYHTGRAPLEAAAQGIQLGAGDWAIRCNLVTVRDERMESFTAGQMANDAGRALMELLQDRHHASGCWQFYPGVSYRNLLVYRAETAPAPFSKETHTIPPHDITDQVITSFLPAGPGSDLLRQLMDDSRALFADCAPNRQRLAQGELPATQIWLWGEGKTPDLPLFQSRFGVQGAVITAVDLLRGIGRLLGWDVIEVAGATGYLDTDYAAKGRAAIETLKSGKDFVVVHVEATDEASHEGHADAKVAALEAIDRDIVGPVHDYLKSQGEYRLLVCPDHPTFLRTKTHSHGFVPFAMCGKGVSGQSAKTYDEIAAGQTGDVLTAGHELMGRFLAK